MTKAELQALIENNLPDNATGQITAAKLREVSNSILDEVYEETDVSAKGIKPFETKALMDAFSPGVDDPEIALVMNDGTAANNAYYRWDGSSWVKRADFYTSSIDPEDTTEAVTGKAVGLYVNDVRSFGAVGDGVANDDAAFRSAEDSLPAEGGVIYIPKGVYVVSHRVRKPNVTIVGDGWNSILKTPPNATQDINDCPLRIFADNCTVRDIAINGNSENNQHLDTSIKSGHADGIAIYSNNCNVDNVFVRNCRGHHIIVWNEAFVDEGYAVGARHGNIVQNCLITEFVVRNPLDFASTQGLGNDYDENINYNNSMINNRIYGPVVIHTGYDTLVQGNHVHGADIVIHSASRRVSVIDNFVDGGTIMLRGGLTGVTAEARRRSKDLICKGNIIRNAGTGAHISIRYVDGAICESNISVNSGSDAIQLVGVTDANIINNKINDCAGRGIAQAASEDVDSSNRCTDITISDNRIKNPGVYCIEFSNFSTLELLKNKMSDINTCVVLAGGSSEYGILKNNLIKNASGSCIILDFNRWIMENNTFISVGTSVSIGDSSSTITYQGNKVIGASRAMSFPVDPIGGISVIKNNEFENISIELIRRLPANAIYEGNIDRDSL